MSKGKSHCRGARNSVLKAFAVERHRRDRLRARRRYDRQEYDKPTIEEG